MVYLLTLHDRSFNGFLNSKNSFQLVSQCFSLCFITELPEYKEQGFRFRSISSLHSHASSAAAVGAARAAVAATGQLTAVQPLAVQKDRIEEERDEEIEGETEQEETRREEGGGKRRGSSGERATIEQSLASSRAIEIWRPVYN